MQAISQDDVIGRIRAENPWWSDGSIASTYAKMRPRPYFDLFFPLVENRTVRRAVVLMGPRRVGKTVMIYHTVSALLAKRVPAQTVCYLSIDHPIYNGLSLEKLIEYCSLASGVDYRSADTFIFLDEIQYLRDWEVHLKTIVDTYPNIKAAASGSAAAALRLRSNESGAGRFTDFLLPPLTFHEFLSLLDKTDLLDTPALDEHGKRGFFLANDIEQLNQQFLEYLNFGGYPEVIFSQQIRSDPARFIKSDIVDKVLLRDLPSLYGIQDIQELNYLFTTLAFNTANEVSLEELSKNSGVAKNTIKRYIEYLEAAFLIRTLHRVDRNAKRFRRANFFKVYLTNPSMRAALFSPLKKDDSAIAALAETAIFAQWFHSHTAQLHYARWQDGEVDIVMLGDKERVIWVVEVKWSDRYCENPDELKSLISFCHASELKNALVTSQTKVVSCEVRGIKLTFIPASIYCYTVGFNIVNNLTQGSIALPLEPTRSDAPPALSS